MGHLGAMWGHLGAMLSHRGVMLGDLGAMLDLCWAILGLCWAILEPSWAYVGPSWSHVGPMLGHLGAHLGPSWGWGYVGARGRPPKIFFPDLCCFCRRAKNTVNYEFFLATHRSAAGAGSPIAKASGLRPGALPVYRACWPDLRG